MSHRACKYSMQSEDAFRQSQDQDRSRVAPHILARLNLPLISATLVSGNGAGSFAH